MKVLINIITPAQIAETQEQFPNFSGTFVIDGETFPPGEWKHVADGFVVPDNRKPFVKNVKWVLRYLVHRYLREQNLQQFAAGIVEAANLYSWPAADKVVPDAIISHAPDEEIAE